MISHAATSRSASELGSERQWFSLSPGERTGVKGNRAFGVINPFYSGWPDDLRIYHEEIGVRGVRLYPKWHNVWDRDAIQHSGRRVAETGRAGRQGVGQGKNPMADRGDVVGESAMRAETATPDLRPSATINNPHLFES